MSEFKNIIADLLKKQAKLKEIILEVPPDNKLGDYAFPCFQLAKTLKKNPNDIAKEIAEKIPKKDFIKEIRVVGPYINFFIDKEKLAKTAFEKITKEKSNYGKQLIKKEKIMIEYPSPNTNKPLHLGHVRNIVIGQSISQILGFLGNTVIRVNLNNDRGIHICKSMLAYKKFGKNQPPNKKPDHFVGDFYVLYNKKENDEMKKELTEMLVKWENNDKPTRALWKKMNSWSLKGFDDTYKKFNLKFDKTYNESEIYDKGKDIVLDGLKKRVFYKDNEGAIAVDLNEVGKKVLLRPDGTSIYITQDIYLASIKFRDFKIDKSIYIAGSEQNYHFKVLFKVLELLGYKFAKKCYHLSYGMVYLPEGRMKSREGTVVDADDLIDEMTKLAEKELRKRYKDLSEKEIKDRSEKIGMAALRFFILKIDAAKDINFDPEESISFEGETGPYVQYAYARISSILEKYGKKVSTKVDYSLLKEKVENDLIVLLGQFPSAIENSVLHYSPHFIARHLIELSQRFNEFYHSCQILKEEKDLKEARLLLIDCIKQVLENGMKLLNIPVLKKM